MTLTNETRKILIKSNVDKAHQAIKDAEMLLNANSFTATLNRIYYGIFYILSALAINNEYSTSKHSQLIGWLCTQKRVCVAGSKHYTFSRILRR